MVNQQVLQGNWNEIKGALRTKWGSLTEDDFAIVNGSMERLVGLIQRKTGEARESVEQFLEQLSSDGGDAISRASETVRAGAHQAADAVQEASHRVAASARKGVDEVEEMVRQHPAESLVACFGAGVVTGVVVALLLRR